MAVNTETMDSSYMVHIRSKDVKQLTSGFNTDLLIDLAAPIKRNNRNQDLHVSLSSAEIPITFYAFSSNLNNLNIYVDGAVSLVIPEGNYDVYEMMAEINSVGAFPYTATYDDNKGKYTLTNTDATLHTINFGDTESRGLSKALGFERANEVVGAGGNTTSDGVVNFQTIHSIFLFSDLNVENVITTGEEVNNIQPIIDKIPINETPFSILHYNPYLTAPFSSKVDNDSIRTFRISLRDQNNNLIQMNDVNFEISLLFEVHNKDQISNISVERDVIIDRPIRRSMTENIQTIPVDENDNQIEEEPVNELIRTLSRQRLPDLNLPPPMENPIITDRTTIKQNQPIKRLTTIEEEEEKEKDKELKGELLDAVLQAQLLTI
tara:strand:- start:865 stop:1998 length:1134 start_codon:yes stop_codon:yes gene_type:complete